MYIGKDGEIAVGVLVVRLVVSVWRKNAAVFAGDTCIAAREFAFVTGKVSLIAQRRRYACGGIYMRAAQPGGRG